MGTYLLDKNGFIADKIIVNQLMNSNGDVFEIVDWTPDFSSGISFDFNSNLSFTTPCKGWIILNQNDIENVEIVINGEIIEQKTCQILVNENYEISNSSIDLIEGVFYPCNSETIQ